MGKEIVDSVRRQMGENKWRKFVKVFERGYSYGQGSSKDEIKTAWDKASSMLGEYNVAIADFSKYFPHRAIIGLTSVSDSAAFECYKETMEGFCRKHSIEYTISDNLQLFPGGTTLIYALIVNETGETIAKLKRAEKVFLESRVAFSSAAGDIAMKHLEGIARSGDVERDQSLFSKCIDNYFRRNDEFGPSYSFCYQNLSDFIIKALSGENKQSMDHYVSLIKDMVQTEYNAGRITFAGKEKLDKMYDIYTDACPKPISKPVVDEDDNRVYYRQSKGGTYYIHGEDKPYVINRLNVIKKANKF